MAYNHHFACAPFAINADAMATVIFLSSAECDYGPLLRNIVTRRLFFIGLLKPGSPISKCNHGLVSIYWFWSSWILKREKHEKHTPYTCFFVNIGSSINGGSCKHEARGLLRGAVLPQINPVHPQINPGHPQINPFLQIFGSIAPPRFCLWLHAWDLLDGAGNFSIKMSVEKGRASSRASSLLLP